MKGLQPDVVCQAHIAQDVDRLALTTRITLLQAEGFEIVTPRENGLTAGEIRNTNI